MPPAVFGYHRGPSWAGLLTPRRLPQERHPFALLLPSRKVITGLMSPISPCSSPMSITTARRSTPTWGAARPTPSAAFMVSAKSSNSISIRGVISLHGPEILRSCSLGS